MSKAMVRAQRAARRVPQGEDILGFLQNQKTRKALVAAASEGEPPVAAISAGLAKLLEPKNLKMAQVKQFAGLCIRAILEEEGYEIERSGVWLGDDSVFSTGSVYRKESATKGAGDDWIERLAAMLTDSEALRLTKALRGRRLS